MESLQSCAKPSIWSVEKKYVYIDGLAQDCSNSSALAMESLQSCAEPSIWSVEKRYAYIMKGGGKMVISSPFFYNIFHGGNSSTNKTTSIGKDPGPHMALPGNNEFTEGVTFLSGIGVYTNFNVCTKSVWSSAHVLFQMMLFKTNKLMKIAFLIWMTLWYCCLNTAYRAILHIEAETKWLPICWRHFEMHFLEWKYINCNWIFTEVCFQKSN